MWVSREMDEKKNVKICFAASSGGHYEQLMMLKPLMEKYDSFIITEKTDYSAEQKGEKTYYMKQVNRREKEFIWRMIQNAWKSIGIYRKEKPDVLLLYSEILHKYSYKPVIYLADDTKEIDKLFEGGYQMPYDIMYNRRFHSANISKITQITYKSMKDGLQEAIALYLQNHTKGNYISTEYDNIVDWYIEYHDLVRWEDGLNA